MGRISQVQVSGEKQRALIADLGGEAHAHRPAPFFRHAHPGPDVVAHPLHAQAALLAGEDVEAHLGPVVDALGNLDGFVFGMIGGLPCRR